MRYPTGRSAIGSFEVFQPMLTQLGQVGHRRASPRRTPRARPGHRGPKRQMGGPSEILSRRSPPRSPSRSSPVCRPIRTLTKPTASASWPSLTPPVASQTPRLDRQTHTETHLPVCRPRRRPQQCMRSARCDGARQAPPRNARPPELAQELRRALDVSEQEGDCAAREVFSHAR